MDAARESAERYRSIVETAVDAILTIDERGRIDSVNASAVRLFGYRPEEMVGQNVRMLMPEPDRSRHDGYLARHLAGGEPRIIGIGREVVGRRNDGSTFHMHLAVGEMTVGGRRMFTGVVRDISGRIAAEEALRASEARYRAIIETAVDGIIGITAEGRIEEFNAAAEGLFGYAADEVIGENVRVLMPEPDRSLHDGYLARHLAGGEPRIIGIGRDVVGRRKDGTRFPMHLGVSEVHHGSERHFTGIVRDMSDLRQAEEALASERDHAASIVTALRDGLVVSSPEGEILEINQPFLEMVGLERSQIVGAEGPPYEWWDPADGERDRRVFSEAMEAGVGEYELTFRRPSGPSFPVRVSIASRRGPDDRHLGFVSTYRDMAPWRDAQEELQRRKEAQLESEALLVAERETQRLKDEFLAMVSHELRTPLSAVTGYLELAIDDVTDPDVRDLLQVAERNAHRLSALVQDLLLVAQAGAGRLPLDRRNVSLGELVSQAVLAARPTAQAKGIMLEEKVMANPTIAADSGRLSQVLDNLISNGIKFSGPGGSVRVGLEVHHGCARITVSDEGPGIPAEDCDRLFDPFYRARQATEELVAGSGLGLAVVKAIVEAHGGSVSVQSEVGRGSIFRTDLPITTVPVTADVDGPLGLGATG